MRNKPPEICMPKAIWDNLLKEVENYNGTVKAYRVITKRRHLGKVPKGELAHPYEVIDLEPIELEFNKEDKSLYKYSKQKKGGAYKTRESGKRYAGAVEIREDTSFTPLDGYWIGREKIDFYIFINSKKQRKAYWVDHNCGKHYETSIVFCNQQ